jgi:hypothetical protein
MLCAVCCADVARAADGFRESQANAAGSIAHVAARESVIAAADRANHWSEGATDVWLLSGNCNITQGASSVRSRDAVVWVDRAADGATHVTLYAEGDIIRDGRQQNNREAVALAGFAEPRQAAANSAGATLVEFVSLGAPEVRAARVDSEPVAKPAIYQRGVDRRFPADNNTIRRTQFTSFDTPAAAPPVATAPAGARRLRVFPRSTTPVRARWQPNGPNEWVAVINSGVIFIVDGLPELGSIDIAADRIVIWTAGVQSGDLGGDSFQGQDVPLEIYMEGNIVFRQGDRTVYADRMYYDVRNHRGTVLDAQIVTPIPEYAGLARLRAEIVRQTDRDHFEAENAALTTSRLGVPSYWFQSKKLTFTDIQKPLVNSLDGAPMVDPATGQPVINHQYMAGGYSNTVYLEGAPIFYWPTIETDLQRPSFYVNEVKIKHDNIFGTQIYTTFDAYQVFGIKHPIPGTTWDFDLDYLSERGIAAGTRVTYDRLGTFLPGPQKGFLDAWGIDDNGTDNLGRDRRELTPEEEFRGRVIGRHKQHFGDNFTITSELGWISDRNFLEQFFEREWDEEKDFNTSFELKQTIENSSWSIYGNTHVNDFFTENENIPRLDHFWLGQPLLFDRLTWYEHSNIGYSKFEPATAPLDPTDAAKFTLLPWESEREGLRTATRNEIDLPFSLGWFKFVPYALGEAAYWGDDLAGDNVDRLYGQVGVRGSIPFWSVNPAVQSELFNVHGLAHKVTLDADFYLAEANRDLDRFPLYDEIDDNAVEQFRRRFLFDTFGGAAGDNVPLMFDARNYAIRSGLASNVTSPSTELADDLMALRFGIRQRWQTKRGPAGDQHIVDLFTLDTRAVYFPKPERDNFGEDIGLAEYDARWHVGDRVTLMSEGTFDFFDRGQRLISAGVFLNRPPNGSFFFGVRSLEGPIDATVLNGSFTYKLSPKWIAAAGASFDLSDDGNIGQNFAITRIGESLLFRAGFNVDASRGSFGATVAVEPRFWPKGKLRGTDGAQVLPPGPYELE